MRLFTWELRKLAGDGPARAGPIILATVIVLGMVGFSVARSTDHVTSLREQIATREVQLPEVYREGFGYARFVLEPTAGVLIPAILCCVLGSLVAGESERGTLAEAVLRSAGRWRMVAAKTGAALVYGAFLTFVAAAVAVLVAPLLLGAGSLATSGLPKLVTVPGGGPSARKLVFEHLEGADAFGRLLLAYALAGASLAPLVSLVVLVSATAQRARTATLVAAGTYFGLYALTHTPGMGMARRYLVLNHFEMWRAALGTSVDWTRIWRGFAVLAVVFCLLTAAAILVFKGREFPPRE